MDQQAWHSPPLARVPQRPVRAAAALGAASVASVGAMVDSGQNVHDALPRCLKQVIARVHNQSQVGQGGDKALVRCESNLGSHEFSANRLDEEYICGQFMSRRRVHGRTVAYAAAAGDISPAS
jgi:hypothetical protein